MRPWPIAERADDITRDESRQFARLVRKLPEPVGPFLMPAADGLTVVAADPYRRRPRFWRRWARRIWWGE